ncbi:MAG: O-antigen ligase family protein, partial [Bacilli bacterium]|nr:O-antigen ligase family protein [Bacilli bacterium]
MKKDILDRIIGIYYVILIIALCFMGGLSSYDVFYSDFISNTLIGFGIVALILYVIYRIRNKSTRYWDLIILIMSFLGYLSYYYAFDKKVALKGFLLGREGLLVIYTYYMTFLLSSVLKNTKMKNRILMTVTICGALQVIYGLLQVFRISNIFGLPIVGNWKYASGFVFNSNFFGSYMVLLNGLWMSRFFFDKEINYKNFLILFIFITGLLISGAMSAVVALLVMFCLVVFINVINKQNNIRLFLRKISMYLVSFLLIYSVVVLWTKSDLTKDIKELYTQSVSTVSGNVDESFGTGRIYIWKEALKYLPDYIYTGIGIDNFAYIGHRNGTYIYD